MITVQARALILHRYGGVYTDLDSEALRPMEQLLQGKEVVLGRMGYDFNSQQSIPNAFMASLPDQHFWLYFLKVIEQVISKLGLYLTEVFVVLLAAKRALERSREMPQRHRNLNA